MDGTGQVGGVRSYARHRGVTHHAVQEAIAAGRLSTLPDGRLDFARADLDWNENTRSRPGRKDATTTTTDGTNSKRRTVAEAHRDLLEARADLVRLQVARVNGELIDAAEVERDAFTTARRVRDLLLSMANRLAPVVAGLDKTEDCYRAIEKEVHDALDELAGRWDGKPSRRVRRTDRTIEAQGARP